MAGSSGQFHVFGLADHDPSILHLVSDDEEHVSSEHVLYLSLLVLQVGNTHLQHVFKSNEEKEEKRTSF